MQPEPPVLPAGFDFPTCDQRVAFTGEFVQGRQALGRQLVGLPEAAVALLRSCKGDTFLANQFWGLHEAGTTIADWTMVRKAILRATDAA